MMRRLSAGLFVTAALCAATAVPTATASAAPAPESAALACLDTAKNYTSAPGSGSQNAHWPGTGKWARTTASCADINIKTNYTRQVRTCFRATGACNEFRSAPKGKWVLAASDVKDGTDFYIQFQNVNASTGQIAY